VASQLAGDGRGRGGAVSLLTKVAICDLVTEDHVPVRDVPKVIVDAYVLMHQRAPEESELITHSKIRDWICELHGMDLKAEIDEFWSCVLKYGKDRVKAHVGHDGTRRTDPEVGHHGELMQFMFSYFNPQRGHAVAFPLSFRFTVGGSASHTANAMAVCLADVAMYTVSVSPDPTIAVKVKVLHKSLLCSVQSDNTGSAINVEAKLQDLTNEQLVGGTWYCPTHINALGGKNPVLALTGDAGTAFDDPNALNITQKWWYICDKHWDLVQHWWPKVGNAPGMLVRPTRGLMGKWQTVGPAHRQVFEAVAEIRRFCLHMEHYATSMYLR
jgi:hypothetical protein